MNRLVVTLTGLALLGAPMSAAARKRALQEPALYHQRIDRPTRPSPSLAGVFPEDRPTIGDCDRPMALIGTLDSPRERAGFFGAEGRSLPSVDGIPFQAPGHFRLRRAEDALDARRGRNGVLGPRDPVMLRGHLNRRTYKADRRPDEAPGLDTFYAFRAGSIQRVALVRLSASPASFFASLQGAPLKLKVTLENPTDFHLDDLRCSVQVRPRDASFPLSRRMDLERGHDFLEREVTRLAPLQRRTHSVRLPGKPDPAAYRAAEADALLGGNRWAYPPLRAGHPVREARVDAGQDLARYLPRRSLEVEAGRLRAGCEGGPAAIRYRRDFRAFGVVLDGLDLEVMAGWDEQQDSRFRGMLERRGHELHPDLRGPVAAALEAKDRPVPVVRRPGGFDEFDAMALHLWGVAGQGAAHHGESADEWGQPWDALYRADGPALPANHREEVREYLEQLRGSRTILRGAGGEPLPFPRDDDHLPAGLRDSLSGRTEPGIAVPAPRKKGSSRPASVRGHRTLRQMGRSRSQATVRPATPAAPPAPAARPSEPVAEPEPAAPPPSTRRPRSPEPMVDLGPDFAPIPDEPAPQPRTEDPWDLDEPPPPPPPPPAEGDPFDFGDEPAMPDVDAGEDADADPTTDPGGEQSDGSMEDAFDDF